MTNDFPTSQLQAAAQCGDWSRMVQLLQTLLLGEQAANLSQNDWNSLVELAVMALEAGDFQASWDVAKVFPMFGDRAIAPLVNLLQDEDAELESRWFAARILGNLHHPAAIRALVEQLQATDDEDLSEMAAGALANLGADAIAALTELLANETARSLAVQALAQIRRPATIAPLLTVVDDAQPSVRALAIEALSSFHDDRIPPVLVQSLRDPAASVRQVAIAGLAVRADLAEQLNLVQLIAEHLWDFNIGVCQQAAIALGRLQSDTAIPPLLRILQSPNTPDGLRLESVRSLGWIGSEAALDALRQCLKLHQNTASFHSFYQEIVATLGRWANPNLKPIAAQILTTELMTAGLTPQTAGTRQAIALALGQLQHPDTLEPLIQLLADEDAGVRLHAIAALKALDAQTAHQRLQSLSARQDISDALHHGIAIALSEWQIELPQ